MDVSDLTGSEKMGSASVFISYRRNDSKDFVQSLFQRLQFYIDKEIIFYDRSSIESGKSFPDEIQKNLKSCRVFLVVIGSKWCSDENLNRLHDEDDFVRKEVAYALECQEIETEDPPYIIPVLYDGASMPKQEKLPESLKRLVDIQTNFTFSNEPDTSEMQIRLLCELIWQHTLCSWASQHNSWFREGLSSDRITSTSRFSQHLSVLHADSKFVLRKSATEALNTWWDSWSEHRQPFVMTGEEGDGKSWAVAAWLAEKVAAIDSNTPVIFIPSICFSEPADCVGAMATAMRKAHNTVCQPDWDAMFRFLTKTSKREVPLLVMVVDGLNESPSQDWRCLFDAVLAATSERVELRFSVAVVVTCRTQYWNRTDFKEYRNRVKQFTLPGYDNEELQAALEFRNIPQNEYSLTILKFLSKPRYLDMAVELRPELEASGADLTVELLICEDWRHRVSLKRGRGLMSHEEFQDFIVSIARKYHGKVDHTELWSEISGRGTLPEVKDELLTSGIFVKRGAKYEPSIYPMILGFGLLLANIIDEHSGESEGRLDEIIADSLGHHDNDFHSQICAMALFHTLPIEDYPMKGRMALFRAWIHGHNAFQTDEDVERIYNNFACYPAIYLGFAEELWSSRSNHHLAQNIFMASFLAHKDRQNVLDSMVTAFERWYGFIHPYGYRGLFERDQNKLEELKKEVENRLAALPLDRYGSALTLVNDLKQLRLAQTAESVVSYLKQELFAQALINGTLASVIMDGSNVDFRWVVRTASKSLHQSLLGKSRELIANGEESALRSAYRLLSWVCNEEALKMRDESIPEEHGFNNSWRNELLKEDRCNSTWILWTEDVYLDCVQRTQLAPISIAKNLKEVALNPLCMLPEELSVKIDTAIQQINLSQARSHLGQTHEDIAIRDIEAAMCAYKPARYAELFRNLTAQMDGRDYLSCRLLASKLYEHLPVLTDDERVLLLKVWRLSLASEDKEAESAELTIFPMVVFDQSPAEQRSLLKERGSKTGYLSGREAQYREIEVGFATATIAALDSNKASCSEKRLALLWYLTKTLKAMNVELRERLLQLVNSDNSIIRYLCLEMICNTDDQLAAQKVVENGWRISTENCDYENGWGSVLLARFAKAISFSELADRISPEWWGYAIKERGDKPDEVAEYALRLHTIWTITAEPSESLEAVLRHVKISIDKNRTSIEENISTDPNENTGLKLVNYTWGGTAGMATDVDFKKSFDPKVAEDEWEKVNKQVKDIYAAEKERGNHWIDTSFTNGNLDVVIASGAPYWREWLKPVLEGSIKGQRLLAFCQGMYGSLCATLLNDVPEAGVELFKAIMTYKTTQIVDSSTDIQHLRFSLFEAKESPPIVALWNEQLNVCDSDKALSEIAYLAQSCGKPEWLDRSIQSWISSERDYDIARGLRLLGFSNEERHGEQLQAWIDGHGRSWLMDVAKISLTSSKRNSWARSWTERFVAEEDRVKSWAAFRLFLRCVDKRFWIWGNDRIKAEELLLWKRDAYRANIGIIIDAVKENEKKLKDTFIAHEVKDNQLWPWMKRYM